MEAKPTASIIINNYNYDRFLQEAINSALDQTYPFVEVVVVDDGSTDKSRDIISSYGNRIIPVLKQNAGQASALNTGVEISKGEVIFFLDADDMFLPNKVEEMVKLLVQIDQENPEVIISNYIETVDEEGSLIDIDILTTLSATCAWDHLHEIRGRKNKLIDGVVTRLSTPEQVYQFASKYRFVPYLGMPTSGFAITRALASKVFPIPCKSIKISADDFIVKGASLLGSVYLTNKVLTKYRIHGKNNWYGSQNKIQEDFFGILDEFLNSKLKMAGREPVFSYFNSIHAKSYYRTHFKYDCDQKLFYLAVKVIAWHINLTTIVFFAKTLVLSLVLRFRRIVADMEIINS